MAGLDPYMKDMFEVTTWKPYAKKVQRHREVFFAFMAEREYELAIQFWKRYDAADAAAQR